MPKSKPKPLPMTDLNKERTLFALVGILAGFFLGFGTSYVIFKPIAPATAGVSTPLPLPPATPAPADPGLPSAGVVLTEAETQTIIQAADQQPDNFALQMETADRLYTARRYSEATRLFERAHRLQPNDDHPIVHLGNAYYDASQWEKAGEWYEKALAINPLDVNVRTDYGLTFWFRTPRQPQKAIEQYQKSLEIEPSHPQTLQNLAIALIEGLQDTKGGEETVNRLERVSPGNPVIAGLRARIKELRDK